MEGAPPSSLEDDVNLTSNQLDFETVLSELPSYVIWSIFYQKMIDFNFVFLQFSLYIHHYIFNFFLYLLVMRIFSGFIAKNCIKKLLTNVANLVTNNGLISYQRAIKCLRCYLNLQWINGINLKDTLFLIVSISISLY